MIERIIESILMFYAELQKLKNTLAILVAVALPLFVAFLSFVIYLSEGHKLINAGTNPWHGYIYHLQKFWAGLLLPLTIILEASLINSIEHSNNMWKQIYTLPVSKCAVYFHKLLAFIFLNILTAVSLTFFIQLFGFLLIFLKPEFGFDSPGLIKESLLLSLKMMLASSAIIGFQFLLSFNFRSFVIPTVIGFCITVGTGIASSWKHIEFLPYSYPSLSTNNHDARIWDIYVIVALLSLVSTSVVGFYVSSKKEIS